jgi:enoyl-CoA hydratase/carnithine racemase
VLSFDADEACRVIVLAAEGKNFCAGASLSEHPTERPSIGPAGPRGLYEQAARLFCGRKPIVAAVQGAAVGGGLGLALVADFRVATPGSRFSANFARLGFFPGFALTHTLPATVGAQRALDLLYTGRRVDGETAFGIGLCDRLVPGDALRREAVALAREIAQSSPLAVPALRTRLRGPLAEAARHAMALEAEQQALLSPTEDFREGIRAMRERRPPLFRGR